MSGLVIALRGDESEKLINGSRAVVTPFVGINGDGEISQLGIGLLISENTAIFWGLVVPHALIQSWRGMKILEQADIVNSSETLCSCFTIAKNNIGNTANHYIESLTHSFGDNVDALQKIRYEVLGSFPSTSEIETMLTKLQEHNVSVDIREIEEAVRIGRVANTHLIDEIIQRKNKLFTHAVLGLG